MVKMRCAFVKKPCLRYVKYGIYILIIYVLWIQIISNYFQYKLNSTNSKENGMLNERILPKKNYKPETQLKNKIRRSQGTESDNRSRHTLEMIPETNDPVRHNSEIIPETSDLMKHNPETGNGNTVRHNPETIPETSDTVRHNPEKIQETGDLGRHNLETIQETSDLARHKPTIISDINDSLGNKQEIVSNISDSISNNPDIVSNISDRIRHKPKIIPDNPMRLNPIFRGHYILNDVNICASPKSANVIVVVHTAPGHFNRRLDIRETYGARKLFLPTEVRVIFLLGRVENQTLQDRIFNEHSKYGDTIQGDFKDAYRNLTHKAVMGLHWVSHFCSDVKYVIKTDDDAVFDMWRFLKEVYAKNLYVSKTIYGIARYNDPIPRSGKWKVSPRRLTGFTNYQFQFCIGFVLIISADVIPDLYRASFKVPFFWLDDVYLTGMLRSAVGAIEIINHSGNLALTPREDGLRCLQAFPEQCPYLAVGSINSNIYRVLWDLFKKRNEK
ncbi:uncharacterized protein LOC126811695 [Patella vulgata]|uniref:uncharacterized protein LOC126811695 n=1 Tax=Patella vulgata TaxID=6465 RepID=UPI00217FB815|nr:uncharacterized protein LOC126811695 [Patella vulgata]